MNLRTHQQHQKKNLDVQAQVYKKQLTGEESGSDDDMGNETIVMGDYNQPPPNPPPSVDPTLKTLATLALGGLFGGGLLAAGAGAMYLLNRPEVAPVIDKSTERVEIGLGKLEDFLK